MRLAIACAILFVALASQRHASRWVSDGGGFYHTQVTSATTCYLHSGAGDVNCVTQGVECLLVPTR